MRRSESSVSYFRDLLDRLEDPTNVKNGVEAGPGGESQIPNARVSSMIKDREGDWILESGLRTDPLNDRSSRLFPIHVI